MPSAGKTFRTAVLETLSADDLRRLAELYQIAGFTDPEDEPARWLQTALAGSLLCAGIFQEDKLIGFGRALGDGASDAYLQDIVIHPDFRGRGLGAQLVRFMIGHLRSMNISWIGLVAAPGREGFYRKLGFAPLAGHTPMLLTGEEALAAPDGAAADEAPPHSRSGR